MSNGIRGFFHLANAVTRTSAYSDARRLPRTCRAAAEKSDAEAQFKLGGCDYNGQGVPQSDEKAAYWYRKAAEQGFEPAQKKLRAMGY